MGLRLVDASKRDVFGAVASIQVGGRTLRRRAHTDGSYAAARDPRVLFGLGERASGPVDVSVEWPGGLRETFPAVGVDRYSTLVKGSGRKSP
jgi:hypothetical protein